MACPPGGREKNKNKWGGLKGSNMKKVYLTLILFAILLTPITAFENLTKTDLKNLKKHKVIQHAVCEYYSDTNRGVTGVFGYHYDSFIDDEWYLATAIFGAIFGRCAGYGIASFGLGRRTELANKWFWDTKCLTGSGGGGGLTAGGGLAIAFQTGVSYEVFDDICIDAKVGNLQFPTGEFNSMTISMGLSYQELKVFLPYE
jgi:hypothetical protein